MVAGRKETLLILALVSQLVAVMGQSEDARLFQVWAERNGIVSKKVKIVDDVGRGMGRGLIAKDDIAEGEVIMRVPESLVMSGDSARRSPVGEVLERGAASVPEWMDGEKIRVATMLMFEQCKQGPASGASCPVGLSQSEWRPYLEVLPKNFSAPIFWSRDEIHELKGSQVLTMLESDVEMTREEWKVVSPLLESIPGTSCCWDFDKFKWALWNVNSRALTLQGKKYLVPIADFVNYEAKDDDITRTDHQEQFLKLHKVSGGFAEIRADRGFEKGDQIVESYGNNPNQMYLRWFGFVPKENPTDCVMISFGVTIEEAQRMKLKEMMIQPQAHACLRYGQEPPIEMFRFLRAISLKGAYELGNTMGGWALNSLVTVRNERAVFRALATKAEQRLSAFATTLEEDEEMIGGGKHVELARRVRISEKRILKSLLDKSRDTLQKTRIKAKQEDAEHADLPAPHAEPEISQGKAKGEL